MFLRLFLFLVAVSFASAEPLRTKNVLFITTDGLRWQEVFRGAEEALLNKANGGISAEVLSKVRRQFWRATDHERRAILLPFVWGEMAKRGQLFGNRDKHSDGHVTNRFHFSYPGYSEFLCGYADDERITTNNAIPNPNVNVLEFLHGLPAFRGRVAAYNTWGVLSSILNRERSGLPMWTQGDTTPGAEMGPVQTLVEQMLAQHPWPWRAESYDVFTFQAAKEYLLRKRPRVFYVNFGENDEWAHAGRYDHYLASIVNVDGFVRDLWETMQALPEYRDSTTLILTTDHGRGAGASSWKDHGEKIRESGQWWVAVLGPDTPPLGERKNCGPVTQAQIAATIAKFIGEDFRSAVPEAAEPIADVFPR
ncbi:MAG TPA: alkaline phosphatase family protein [Chthoniobacteraceae bacterium]|jgi:hypothetical protein|nr:alkaline phosphatase family protein [Chthoniobacteraceae bacterium]